MNSLPLLEDERMGLDVLSLTLEGDISLLSAFDQTLHKKFRSICHFAGMMYLKTRN